MFHYPQDDTTGSVGYFLPNCDAKCVSRCTSSRHHRNSTNKHRIINDNGEDITAFDTTGELCVRGPIVVSGYFENPAANADSFDSEGFFKTGDIVYCDGKSKKWYIVDRKKELIKVRGFQVAPPELETVLLTHPQIVDAAVIGIKSANEPDVELPRAYVVKRPGNESEAVDELAVKKYCGQKLAKYKELTGGVKFVGMLKDGTLTIWTFLLPLLAAGYLEQSQANP
jgi:acyl-CoA synthetase (AMP-forming)/AMP-acid ligase II